MQANMSQNLYTRQYKEDTVQDSYGLMDNQVGDLQDWNFGKLMLTKESYKIYVWKGNIF